MNVMLLCAGEGTRLRPYTLTTPKPAIPFLNVPLAFYSLNLLQNMSIDTLVVNTFHLPDQIHQLFLNQKLACRELYFSDEKDQILGSAGGILHARKKLEGKKHFLLFNGDEVILPEDPHIIEKFYRDHIQSGALATILTTQHPGVGTKFGGMWTNSKNELQEFNRKIPMDKTLIGQHSIGVMAYRDDLFKWLSTEATNNNIFYNALTDARKAGELVKAYPIKCHWFETGNPQDFAEASHACETLLKNGQSPYLESLLKKWGRNWPDVIPLK